MSRAAAIALCLAGTVALGSEARGERATLWQESVDPTLSEVTRHLAAVRGALAIRGAGRETLESALALATRAGQLRPADAEVRHLRGETLYRLDRFADAAEELAAAERLDPTGPRAHEAAFDLGVALTRLERFEEAAAAYERFLGESPWPTTRAIALTNLAETRMAQGRLEDAVDSYRLAIATAPRYTHAYLGLAVALDRTGDEEGGREAMVTAMSTGAGLEELDNPAVFFVPDWEHHYYRALALEVAGEVAEARIHWQDFLSEGGASGPFADRAQEHLRALDGRP